MSFPAPAEDGSWRPGYTRIPVTVVEYGDETDDEEATKDKAAKSAEMDVRRLTKWPSECSIDSPCYNLLCRHEVNCRDVVEEVQELDMSYNAWKDSNEGRFTRWLLCERNSKNRDRIERGGTPPASSDTPAVTSGDSDSNPPPTSPASPADGSSGWSASHSLRRWR